MGRLGFQSVLLRSHWSDSDVCPQELLVRHLVLGEYEVDGDCPRWVLDLGTGDKRPLCCSYRLEDEDGAVQIGSVDVHIRILIEVQSLYDLGVG